MPRSINGQWLDGRFGAEEKGVGRVDLADLEFGHDEVMVCAVRLLVPVLPVGQL